MGVYKRKESVNYYIDYYDAAGNRIREPVSPSRREAEIVLSKRLTEVRENKHPILKKKEIKKIKLVDFAEKYIKEHAKPLKKSYKCDISRLKNLMPYFGDLCLDEITSYHLAEYRKQRMQEKGANRKTLVTPSTINRELGILRNMLRLASEWYEIQLKPLKFEMAKEEQKERIFSESEIRRLIDNSDTPLRHIIMVAINTGMRMGEILNLEWDQVNLEGEFITVVAQKSETRRIRRIPLNHSMSGMVRVEWCQVIYFVI